MLFNKNVKLNINNIIKTYYKTSEKDERNAYIQYIIDKVLSVRDDEEIYSDHYINNVLTICILLPLNNEKIINMLENENDEDAHLMDILHNEVRDSSRRVCAYTFKNGDIAWNCKDCQTDETCVLCNNCFMNSKHDKHQVFFYYAQSGGCCDCGDTEAWKETGFCHTHQVANQLDPIENLSKALRDGITNVIKMIIMEIKRILNTMIKCFYNSLDKVEKQLLELSPYNDDISLYSFILFPNCLINNLEYLEQIKAVFPHADLNYISSQLQTGKEITLQTKLQKRQALELGGSLIRLNSLKYNENDCCGFSFFAVPEIRFKKEKEMAKILINYIANLSKVADAFCRITGNMLLDKTDFATIENEKRKILLLMIQDKLPKDVIKSILSLILILLSDPVFKRQFAICYACNYEEIVVNHVKGRTSENNDLSINNFSVQFLNRPSYVELLVYNYNFINTILKSFYSLIFMVTKNNKLSQNEISAGHPVIMRCQYSFVFNDLRYVLQISGIPYYFVFDKSCKERNYDLFIRILSLLQNIHLLKRETCLHVEYESSGWIRALELLIPVADLYPIILKGVYSDTRNDMNFHKIEDKYQNACYSINEDGFNKVIKVLMIPVLLEMSKWYKTSNDMLSKKVTEDNVALCINKSIDEKKNTTVNFGSDLEEDLFLCNETVISILSKYTGKIIYTIPKHIVSDGITTTSIHYPLHCLFAQLLQMVCFIPNGLQTLLIQHYYHSTDMYSMLMEYPMRSIVLASQVQCGMWKKNGPSVEDYIYNYSFNIGTTAYLRDLDILLLQYSYIYLLESRCGTYINHCIHGFRTTSFNDIFLSNSHFLCYVMEKFELTEFFSSDTTMYDEITTSDSLSILEYFLLFLSHLVTELPNDYQKGIDSRLRREILHLLLLQNCTHSQIVKLVDGLSFARYYKLLPTADISKNMENIINSILSELCVEETSDIEKYTRKYKLRNEFFAEYDPTFYHLTNKQHTMIREKLFLIEKNKQTSIPIIGDVNYTNPCHEFFLPLRLFLLLDPVFFHFIHVTLLLCHTHKNETTEILIERSLHLLTLQLHMINRLKKAANEDNRFLFYERSFNYTEIDEYVKKYIENWEVESLLVKFLPVIRDKKANTTVQNKVQITLLDLLFQIDPNSSKDNSFNLKHNISDASNNHILSKNLLWVYKIISSYSTICKKKVDQHLHQRRNIDKVENTIENNNVKDKQLLAQKKAIRLMKEKQKLFADTLSLDDRKSKIHENVETECSMCHHSHYEGSSILCYPGFAQVSTVYSFPYYCKNGNLDSKSDNSLFNENIYYSICGHVLHNDCWSKYYISQLESSVIGDNHIELFNKAFDVTKGEFLCPVCKNLSNILIPVVSLNESLETTDYRMNEMNITTASKGIGNNDKNDQKYLTKLYDLNDDKFVNIFNTWLMKPNEKKKNVIKSEATIDKYKTNIHINRLQMGLETFCVQLSKVSNNRIKNSTNIENMRRAAFTFLYTILINHSKNRNISNKDERDSIYLAFYLHHLLQKEELLYLINELNELFFYSKIRNETSVNNSNYGYSEAHEKQNDSKNRKDNNKKPLLLTNLYYQLSILLFLTRPVTITNDYLLYFVILFKARLIQSLVLFSLLSKDILYKICNYSNENEINFNNNNKKELNRKIEYDQNNNEFLSIFFKSHEYFNVTKNLFALLNCIKKHLNMKYDMEHSDEEIEKLFLSFLSITFSPFVFIIELLFKNKYFLQGAIEFPYHLVFIILKRPIKDSNLKPNLNEWMDPIFSLFRTWCENLNDFYKVNNNNSSMDIKSSNEFISDTNGIKKLILINDLFSVTGIIGLLDIKNEITSNDVIRLFPKRLPELPESYVMFYSLISNDLKCNNCMKFPERPALCLICHEIICEATSCKKNIPTNHSFTSCNSIGACTRHVKICTGGVGIFFLVMEGIILLMNDSRATYSSSIYSDEYGETFGEMQKQMNKGRLLHLNNQQFHFLQNIWLNHQIPNQVNKSYLIQDKIIRRNYY